MRMAQVGEWEGVSREAERRNASHIKSQILTAKETAKQRLNLD